MKQPEQYLGDAVYVEFDSPYYILRTSVETLGKNEIILDADQLTAFDRYRRMVEENEAEEAGLRAHAALL